MQNSFRFLGIIGAVFFAIYVAAVLNAKSTGSFGQWLGFYAFLLLGKTAYLIPLLTVLFAIDAFFRRRESIPIAVNAPFWSRLSGALGVIFSLSGLIALQAGGNDTHSGGVVGQWLDAHLTLWFGPLGSFLLLNFFLLLGLVLAAAISWLQCFESSGKLVFSLLALILRTFRGQEAYASHSTNPHSALRRVPASKKKQPTGIRKRLLPSIRLLVSGRKSSVDRLPEETIPSDPQIAAARDRLPKLARELPDVLDVPSEVPADGDNVACDPTFASNGAPLKAFVGQQNPTIALLPPLALLDRAQKVSENQSYSKGELNRLADKLVASLASFNIGVTLESILPGPVITRFEVLPSAGVKVSQISSLEKDIARSMAVQSVRVVEVIPGKSVIGIEIPNRVRETVNFRDLLGTKAFRDSQSATSIALGKDISGKAMVVDLAKMPHLLVAGTTGSGKSVGVNAMILSMLYKAGPDRLRMIMIDPKMLELSTYDGIPHLLTPVVTDTSKAANALKWCVAEMERRYKLMSLLGVRNIRGLNEKIAAARAAEQPLIDPLHKPAAHYGHEIAEPAPELESMSYIVVVIDEFADLIMVVGKVVEELIARLAQKARAAGIHLILATQRPSVNVITGLIKANIPTRISFQVSTKIDSRTILDQGGAEQLLGMGDMLFLPPGTGLPVRVHGAFVSDDEVHRVANFVRSSSPAPEYVENMNEEVEPASSAALTADACSAFASEDQALYQQALDVVMNTGKASISRVQRELRIGYNRAARLIEDMERNGVVSEANGHGQRAVLERHSRDGGSSAGQGSVVAGRDTSDLSLS